VVAVASTSGVASLLEQASLPGGGADGRVPGPVHKTKVNSLQIKSFFSGWQRMNLDMVMHRSC